MCQTLTKAIVVRLAKYYGRLLPYSIELGFLRQQWDELVENISTEWRVQNEWNKLAVAVVQVKW